MGHVRFKRLRKHPSVWRLMLGLEKCNVILSGQKGVTTTLRANWIHLNLNRLQWFSMSNLQKKSNYITLRIQKYTVYFNKRVM